MYAEKINKISFPARAYMKPVMQWAVANQIKFFTAKQQRMALARYELFVAQLN